MPSPNRILIATAGSGKTTQLASKAVIGENPRTALITYTRNGTAEIRDKVFSLSGVVPNGMHIGTWFTFLTAHVIRPYQRALYTESPVRRVAFIEGRSVHYVSERDVDQHYFRDPGQIYSDKISKFALRLIDETNGLPIQRLEKIFDSLLIDEVQDLAGYDLDLIERFLDSALVVEMVGDIRQATYRTNNAAKNSQFAGRRIIGKFNEWKNDGRASLDFDTNSFRCVQAICDFSDRLYPDLPCATSQNHKVTGHDGMFAVRESLLPQYMQKFSPQVLRLDKKTKDVPGNPLNYGAAKGMTFERVLIFPHQKLLDVIRLADFSRLGDADVTIAKVYVGVTRARQSVAFAVPDDFVPAEIPLYEEN